MRQLLIFLIILLTEAPFATAQRNQFGVGATPSAANTLLSSTCVVPSANCYLAHADTRWTGDGVTTNGQNTLTSATMNFSPADDGKHCFLTDLNSSDSSNYQTVVITGFCHYTGSTTSMSVWQDTRFTIASNANFSATGLSSKYFTVIGFKDTAPWFSAYQASLSSNISLNGVPNALVVDCGTYLVDSIIEYANFNNYQHNISGSTLPWYPKCVTVIVSDDFNYTAAQAVSGTTCVLICNANGGEKSAFPDLLQQSGMGTIRDMTFLGPGLTLSSQAGVIWIQMLNEFSGNQIVNFPGPSSSVSKLLVGNWYQGLVYNNQIEPGAGSTQSNPPIDLDVNATRFTVAYNRLFGDCGVNVQIEAGQYQVTVTGNQFTGQAGCTNPFVSDLGSRQTIFNGNYCNLQSASSTCFQQASGANTLAWITNNLVIFTAAGTGFNIAGNTNVGANNFNGASGTAYTNSGYVNHTFGQDYYGTFSGLTFTNTGTWLAMPSEQGQGACAGSTATITFLWPSHGGGYKSSPTVVVSDVTTSGGARISARNTTTATVTCTGATDAFDYTVTPNPF